MKPRGRPKKERIVRTGPRISHFSPRGKPGRPEEIELKLDEFEAIRLADLSGLSQKQAAALMNISQQTFSRILKNARTSLAEALVKGQIIKIQGGSYLIKSSENPPQKSPQKPIT